MPVETDANTDIVLLAAYWNERNWVEPSLEQIRSIDPAEVIISDGCFDPTKLVPSTDGTREVIEDFVANYNRATMISARRPSTLDSLLAVLRGRDRSISKRLRSPSGWKAVYKTIRSVAYRRNQAATFNRMVQMSDYWAPGNWFMTYDCDQFYTEEMIDQFSLTKQELDAGLLTGRELTFFESFDKYTEEYETRRYNNMPHKIYPGTMIRPTRDIALETPMSDGINESMSLSSDLYINQVETLDTGEYHHYKIRDPNRMTAAYDVGNRERPEISDYTFNSFEGNHPATVASFIEEWGK